MEVMSKINISNTPYEVKINGLPYKKTEKYSGKYFEYGESMIHTEFDLIKTENIRGEVSYEVNISDEFDASTEDFICKNILNELE